MTDRMTLGELLYKLVQEKRTDGDEFAALRTFYTREYLLREYRKQVLIEKQKREKKDEGSKDQETDTDAANGTPSKA